MVLLMSGAFSLACWLLFFLFFHRDRARYRNCYLLALALVSPFPFLINLLGYSSTLFLLVLTYAVLLAILIVPFFLIYNGIEMIRREGRHLSQLLSLLLGLAILAGEAITFTGLWHDSFSGTRLPRTWLTLCAAAFAVSVIYLSVSFLVFMIYTLFLQHIPRKKDFDFVIIHGAGLLDGDRVSKLLRDRLDKAIEVYREDPTPPLLIPSGGKGHDETVPEAEAMARYLMSQGIPEKDILKEDQSTTTLENLLFSKRILDTFSGRKYTALVSSNYHVYRALRYCREIGLECTGIGSHVAFYYWPSALIREYIAIHTEKKHAVILFLGWAASLSIVLFPLFS